MNTSKSIIYVTLIICIIIIAIPTVTKVININHNNLHEVTNKTFEETARQCIYDGVCKTNHITLEDLYNNNYLTEELTDPVEKIVYNKSSYIIINEKNTSINYQY